MSTTHVNRLYTSEIVTYIIGSISFIASFFFPFLNREQPFIILWKGVIAFSGNLEEILLFIQLGFPYALLVLFVSYLFLSRIKDSFLFIFILTILTSGMTFLIHLAALITLTGNSIVIYIQLVSVLVLASVGVFVYRTKQGELKWKLICLGIILFMFLLHVLHNVTFQNYYYFLYTLLLYGILIYYLGIVIIYIAIKKIDKTLIVFCIIPIFIFIINNLLTSFMYSISLGNNEYKIVRMVSSLYLVISVLIPLSGWRKIRHFSLSHGLFLWFRYVTTVLIASWFVFVLLLSSTETFVLLYSKGHSVYFFIQEALQKFFGNIILVISAILLSISFYIQMIIFRRRYY